MAQDILTAGLLYGKHPWLFSLAFFVLLLAVGEAGFRLGHRSPARRQEEAKTGIGTVEAGILGVLGLLLAFTLVMAVSRFDTRRQLVLEEANAIGTSYWRSRLVPPPDGPELANLLREYVDAKLHFFDPGFDPDLLGPSRERVARLQGELWSRAAGFARKDSRSVPAGLLLQALNQVFDLDAARWNALVIHVPETVIRVDGLIGLAAVLVVGYTFGLGGRRNPFSMGLLALCLATVLAVIVDLDQPGRGLIRVSQQPLVDLEHQLESNR